MTHSIPPCYQRFLLDLLDNFVFTEIINDNGDYWKRVFDRRNLGEDDGAHYTEIAPFTDIFKMVIVKLPDKEDGFPGEFVHTSIVPCCPFFYDTILSYYLLSDLEFYQSPRILVTMLLKTMADLKIDPSAVQNFPAGIWRWMTRIREGEIGFDFIQHPLTLCFHLKWIVWMVNKYGEEGRFVDDPESGEKKFRPGVWDKGFMDSKEVLADELKIREGVEFRFRQILNNYPELIKRVTLSSDGTPNPGLSGKEEEGGSERDHDTTESGSLCSMPISPDA